MKKLYKKGNIKKKYNFSKPIISFCSTYIKNINEIYVKYEKEKCSKVIYF